MNETKQVKHDTACSLVQCFCDWKVFTKWVPRILTDSMKEQMVFDAWSFMELYKMDSWINFAHYPERCLRQPALQGKWWLFFRTRMKTDCLCSKVPRLILIPIWAHKSLFTRRYVWKCVIAFGIWQCKASQQLKKNQTINHMSRQTHLINTIVLSWRSDLHVFELMKDFLIIRW